MDARQIRGIIGRRDLLRRAGLVAGMGLMAACQPQPAATNPETQPAARATEPPKPVAPTTVAASPSVTAPPVAQATASPAAQAAAPSPAAASAARPAEPKLGANLIGKIEGPTVILDAAQMPKTFKEAPALAEQVKSGTLPPVEQRVSQEPLVLKPVQETGRYGGTWRRGFTGPADFENGCRIVSTDKLLFWDYTGTKVMPSVAREWKVSEDGKTITLSLRKGMKWSDGQPFTANDFVFWWEDLYQNKELVPGQEPELVINGKSATMRKLDDTTVAFEFPEPNYLFVDQLASASQIGGGLALRGRRGMGAYAPAHYLKQFLPKYTPKEELDKKVKELGFDNWVNLYKSMASWEINTDLPVLTPWRTVTPARTSTWTLERNPYYWAVDTEGNQLPYIDKIQMTLAENLEVVNLRAIAGEYDEQERHTDMGKLPVFLENQQRGNYKVRLDPALNGSDAAIHVNMSYAADPALATWLTNKDFRHALALGIDRDQLNETFWLGVGTPGSIAPSESMPQSPGPEYRKKWAVLDVKQANDLLDKLGLSKKDGEGYRVRTDNGQRLRLELMTAGGAFMPYTQIADMIRSQWRQIGIQADVKEVERSLSRARIEANEHHLYMGSNDGSELIFLYPRHVIPVEPTEAFMGPLFARWYATAGRDGKEPPSELKRTQDLIRQAPTLKPEDQTKAAQEIWRLAVEEQWTIGLVGQSPSFMGVRIVKNTMGNVPDRQVNAQHARTPGSSHPATFFFKG